MDNRSEGRNLHLVTDQDPATKDAAVQEERPDLAIIFSRLGGREVGEVVKYESLPPDISQPAREMFWVDRPIKIFVFPNDVKIYAGNTKRIDRVAVATFRGEEYRGYDHDMYIEDLPKEVERLSGDREK